MEYALGSSESRVVVSPLAPKSSCTFFLATHCWNGHIRNLSECKSSGITNGIVAGVITLLVGLVVWGALYGVLAALNISTTISQTLSDVNRMQRTFSNRRSLSILSLKRSQKSQKLSKERSPILRKSVKSVVKSKKMLPTYRYHLYVSSIFMR